MSNEHKTKHCCSLTEEMEEINLDKSKETTRTNRWKVTALLLLAALLVTQLFGFSLNGMERMRHAISDYENRQMAAAVTPEEGVVIPVRWNDLGRQLINSGVIDVQKFEALYSQRGGLGEEEKRLLYGGDNGALKMNPSNAGVFLNLLWAFGLANNNPILEEGPMNDLQYGGDPSGFASIGGWTLARGDVMDHYSKHQFVRLTPEQQEMVERVARSIYRPCCNNSVYFPDCNHGMAMLGLLELMASQGVAEAEMYDVALRVNSYWFPDTYITIAKYFKERGVAWDAVSSKDILGSLYSSASGYRQILTEITPPQQQSGGGGGGGCGV